MARFGTRNAQRAQISSGSSPWVFVNACGCVHRSDLPSPRPISVPSPWRPLLRRRALADVTSERARIARERTTLSDWPDPADGNTVRSPHEVMLSPLSPAAIPVDESAHEEAVTRFLGYTKHARPITRTLNRCGHDDRRPAGESACRSAWFEHCGSTETSGAGAVRHAAAALFPDAAELRPSDLPAPCPTHEEMCAYLKARYRDAQRHFTDLGIHALTLHRGWHAAYLTPDHGPDRPFGRMVRDAVEDGSLSTTPDESSSRFVHLDGEFVAGPIVSTIDGWSTHRTHAEHWSTYGSDLTIEAVMSAEVPVSSILDWATLGVGDSSGNGSAQEVLVLGAPGRVRWRIKGILDLDPRPA